MKNLLKNIFKTLSFLLLLSILTNCTSSTSSVENYHGIEYKDCYDDIVTLPLEAFGDFGTTSGNLEGIFILGIGVLDGNINNTLKYRFIVKFPDKTMKTMEFEANDNVYLKYGPTPSITATVQTLKKGYNPYHTEVIIQIPKGSIQYNNKFDGQ